MNSTHDKNDTERSRGRQRRPEVLVTFALILSLGILGGCDAEQLFTQGRVREPCSAVFPTCHSSYMAGCYLNEDKYTEGNFPGARRILVGTTNINQIIRVRLFLKNMLYPGTEILVQAYEPDCSNVEQDLRQDVDVFEEAGDDYVLIFDLPAETPGDHLIELYSDCASDYLLIAEQFIQDED